MIKIIQPCTESAVELNFHVTTEWDISRAVSQVDHQIKTEAKSLNNYKNGKITHASSVEILPRVFHFNNF